MPGNGRLFIGNVAWQITENVLIYTRDYHIFATMIGELLQQFEIGETEPHSLYTAKYLIRPRAVYLLAVVSLDLVWTDQLNGLLNI